MANISRRAVVEGPAWTVPAVSVAAAAPSVVKGQALPASAFAPGCFIVADQTFGGVANNSISIAAGLSLTSAAAACIGSAEISHFAPIATSNGGPMALTTGRTSTVTGGAGVAGSGTVGTTNGGCSGPSGAVGMTQRCSYPKEDEHV